MPRQRSRSPLSPILATESATVRLFFILSVLLCSVNNAGLKTETWLLYCLRLRSRSPHNAKHSTSSIRKGVKSPTSGDAPTDQIPALIPTRLWWGEVGHIIDRCITVRADAAKSGWICLLGGGYLQTEYITILFPYNIIISFTVHNCTNLPSDAF